MLSFIGALYANKPSQQPALAQFTIEYKLSEDTLIFGFVAKGGKPSGVSTVGASSGGFDTELFRFWSESMWVYAIGQKSTFDDGRGKFNLDGYCQDFSNKQVLTKIVRSNGSLGTRAVNASGAQVYGAELELCYAPTTEINLNLACSYIDSKYTNFFKTGPGPCLIIGNWVSSRSTDSKLVIQSLICG